MLDGETTIPNQKFREEIARRNAEAKNRSERQTTKTLPRGRDLIPKKFSRLRDRPRKIIGAGGESDRQILTTTENLYHTFKMKRVYYSAYIPVVSSPVLPDPLTAPPLGREHRLYQADWLLRFYGFQASELLDEENPNLDPDLDPKVTWALRHLDQFPIEVNKAPMNWLLRIPGVGVVSAQRIVRQRKCAAVKYEDLKKMGVVLKRAKYFLTCSGKFYGEKRFMPDVIKNQILQINDGIQISMFGEGNKMLSTNGAKGEKAMIHG